MGLLRPKAERQADKAADREADAQALLRKLGINVSPEDINKMNLESLNTIKSMSRGNKLIMAGLALSMGNQVEQTELALLSALIEQNWILIRQNEAILRKLDQQPN